MARVSHPPVTRDARLARIQQAELLVITPYHNSPYDFVSQPNVEFSGGRAMKPSQLDGPHSPPVRCNAGFGLHTLTRRAPQRHTQKTRPRGLATSSARIGTFDPANSSGSGVIKSIHCSSPGGPSQ